MMHQTNERYIRHQTTGSGNVNCPTVHLLASVPSASDQFVESAENETVLLFSLSRKVHSIRSSAPEASKHSIFSSQSTFEAYGRRTKTCKSRPTQQPKHSKRAHERALFLDPAVHSETETITLKDDQRTALDSFVDSLKPVVNEMHTYPSSPNSSQSEDDAATKIQAGFRGYRVRKQMRQGRSGGPAGSSSVSGAGQSTGSVGQQRSPRVTKKPTLEDNSATKIQAGVRGFLVRKRQKTATDAATKIQASFRGFKTRKDLKSTVKKDK